MTAHRWEQLQVERAQAAALATVGRLAQALAELEAELAYRREALGEIIAARNERGARVLAAHAAGALVRFGGSNGANAAEASWADAPADAVQVLAQHITDAPHLHHQETQALVAIDSLERRVLQTRRALAHWRAVAGNTESPASVRAQAGPIGNGAVETAEAAAVAVADHEPPTATPPAAPFSARLAELGRRVAGW